MKCVICKKNIDIQRWENPGKPEAVWDKGHNAEPVANGRCCTKCINEVVIPKRIVLMRLRDKW